MELEISIRLGSRSDGSLRSLMGVFGAGMVCFVQTFNYGVSLRSSWTQFLFVGVFGVDFDAFLSLASDSWWRISLCYRSILIIASIKLAFSLPCQKNVTFQFKEFQK